LRTKKNDVSVTKVRKADQKMGGEIDEVITKRSKIDDDFNEGEEPSSQSRGSITTD